MKQIRYNEVKDILEMNEILFVEKEHDSISIQMPQVGECTYWGKKDKLHIHKQNQWFSNGYYKIKELIVF